MLCRRYCYGKRWGLRLTPDNFMPTNPLGLSRILPENFISLRTESEVGSSAGLGCGTAIHKGEEEMVKLQEQCLQKH